MTAPQPGWIHYTQGWNGLILAYGSTLAGMVAGLVRVRAPLGRYLRLLFINLVVTVGAMLLWVILGHLLEWALKLQSNDLREALFGVAVFPVVGFFGGLRYGSSGPGGIRYKRGAGMMSVEAFTRLHRPRNINRRVVRLAGLDVPAEDESKHFKLIGTTGTGKSTLIRELLSGALARGDRAVIADPDGGYLSKFYDPARGDVILNPFDARSAQWNVFAEVTQPYDVAQLARSLIPELGGDPQWPGFSRTFFESVMTRMLAGNVRELPEFYRLLTAAPQSELRVLLAGTPAAPFTEEGSLKLFLGQRSTSSEHLKCLEYVLQQKGATPLSVKRWIREGKGVLFLPYLADQIASLRYLIATWLRLAIFQTMSLGEGDHRLWFAIDELDALGKIDGLSDALTRLRKFGGRCVLGLQSIGPVASTFGRGAAEAMIENCGNTYILRCSASEHGGTAKFASQLMGEREVIRTVTTQGKSFPAFFGRGGGHTSVSTSQQHALEPLILPAQIEQLPDRTGYLKFASQAGWMHVEFPFVDLPTRSPTFVPADSAATVGT